MADEDDKTTHDEHAEEAEEAESTEADEEVEEADEEVEEADDADDDDAASDDDEPDEAPAPKKKAKKKRTKKAGSTKTAAKKKSGRKKAKSKGTSAPVSQAQVLEGEDDNGTMLALGAFVLAILAIGALWWWNNRGDESAEAEEIPTLSADEAADGTAEREPADLPSNLAEALGHAAPARPPGPEPIPAPDDVAAPPDDATTTESGLAYRVIQAGTGEEHPGETDRVTVHYTGWTTDGEMFDSSRTRGRPATFPLNRVIAGWTEGVQLMVVGEQTRFWIPQDLAYGGRPGAPAGMLVFDVELVSFEATPQPPPTPDDVAAVPSNATRTESGLAYRVLQEGTGTEHPSATSRVSVHYTGWTTDGESFDSSITRGRPASFRLNGVIAGWTEGVQLMVVGERTRFWIPEELAYGGRPGAPAGMLVFDVELLEILPTPTAPPGMPSGHPGAPPAGHP